MIKFAEFEKKVINRYKRGLITVDEALIAVASYLRAMVDFGILTEDRVDDEYLISSKKIFEIKLIKY